MERAPWPTHPVSKMPRKNNTASKILDIAQPLLQQRGFRGFSFSDLARALGIKAAAIHYHFHAKEDLGVALVGRLRRQFQRWTAHLETHTPSARDRLTAFCETHALFIEQDAVSATGILQAEYSTLPSAMQNEVRQFTTEVVDWLTATLRSGKESGELAFPGEAQAQAILVAATVQGALQMARATGSETFHKASTQLQTLLTSVSSENRRNDVDA